MDAATEDSVNMYIYNRFSSFTELCLRGYDLLIGGSVCLGCSEYGLVMYHIECSDKRTINSNPISHGQGKKYGK